MILLALGVVQTLITPMIMTLFHLIL